MGEDVVEEDLVEDEEDGEGEDEGVEDVPGLAEGLEGAVGDESREELHREEEEDDGLRGREGERAADRADAGRLP